MPILNLTNVSKSFGLNKIYQNVSFSFKAGCYAIVGPNGTGKSVLMEMLAGVLPQDSGTITLENEGHNTSAQYKEALTFIPGAPSFFSGVTGDNFLKFIQSIKAPTNNVLIDKFIDGFRLKPYLCTRFSDMSLGTQKKLFLTTLALGSRKLIIMDEPSNALDAVSVTFLAREIADLSRSGIVIIATHDQDLLKEINHTVINLAEPPMVELKQHIQVAKC